MTDSFTKTVPTDKRNGDVSVSAKGASVDIHADGSIDAYTKGAVIAHRPDSAPNSDQSSSNERKAPEQARTANPQPGDRMPDGTIYAGDSPDTHKPMYTTIADAPDWMQWNPAQEYAAKLDQNGHKDWRLPTHNELTILFNNRAAIGGFKCGEFDAAHWSASEDGSGRYHWSRNFRNGETNGSYYGCWISVRCIRTGVGR